MKKPFDYQQPRGNPGIFARASLGDYAQLVSIFVAIGGLIFLYSQVKIAQQTLDLSFHPTVEAVSVAFAQAVPGRSEVSVKVRNTGTSDAVNMGVSIALRTDKETWNVLEEAQHENLAVGESKTLTIPLDTVRTAAVLSGGIKLILSSRITFNWSSNSHRGGGSCTAYLFDPASHRRTLLRPYGRTSPALGLRERVRRRVVQKDKKHQINTKLPGEWYVHALSLVSPLAVVAVSSTCGLSIGGIVNGFLVR